MQAVANNPKFAKKVGVNQSIGREFTKENGMKKNYMYGGKVKKMNMGGRTGDMMYSRGYGADKAGKRMPTELMTAPGMKMGGKVKKMKRGGNTSRMNDLEELGRVDNEKGYTAKGKRNLAAEKRRVVKEIENKKAGGKVKAFKPHMMYDKKTGKAVKAPTKAKHLELKKKGYGHTKVKKMAYGGKVKKMKMGGKVSSASKRADGIAQRGRTRGHMR